MVGIIVSTSLTGVPRDGQHGYKAEVIRHVLTGSKNSKGEWYTLCGAEMHMLPKTWQAERNCKRCWAKNLKRPLSTISVTLGYPAKRTDDLWDQWPIKVMDHAVHVIRTCASKKYARQVAVDLGFETPEDILTVFPDLKQYIVYIRPPKSARLAQG